MYRRNSKNVVNRRILNIIVYADDVTVVVEADNEMEVNQKIVKVLSQMSKWSKQNYIGLNYSKCCYINFSLRKMCQSIDMLIDGEVINECGIPYHHVQFCK